jgi:hypothetical protein
MTLKILTSWISSFKITDYLISATKGVEQRSDQIGNWAVTQLQKKAIYQETLKGSLTRWVFSTKFRTPIEALDALDRFATTQLGRVQRVKPLVICFTDLQTYARELKTILQRSAPLHSASDDVQQKALEEILPVLETACREKLRNLDSLLEESEVPKPLASSSPMKTMQSLAGWAFGHPGEAAEKEKQIRKKASDKAEKQAAYEALPQGLRDALAQVKSTIDAEIATQEQTVCKGIISTTIDAATQKLTSLVTSGLVYGLTAWGTKVAANTAVQYAAQPQTEEEEQQYTRQIANTVYLTFLTTLVLSYSLRIAIWKRRRETTPSPVPVSVTNQFGTSYNGLDKPSFVQRTAAAARGAIARLTGLFAVNIDPGVTNFEHRTH